LFTLFPQKIYTNFVFGLRPLVRLLCFLAPHSTLLVAVLMLGGIAASGNMLYINLNTLGQTKHFAALTRLDLPNTA